MNCAVVVVVHQLSTVLPVANREGPLASIGNRKLPGAHLAPTLPSSECLLLALEF